MESIKGLHCLETVIYVCAQLLNLKNFKLCLGETMGFSIDEVNYLPINRIDILKNPRDYKRFGDSIRKYCGMELVENLGKEFVDKNNIGVLLIDSYFAHWIKRYYKRMHMKHYIVLYKKNEKIEMYDPNFNYVDKDFQIHSLDNDILIRKYSVTVREVDEKPINFFINQSVWYMQRYNYTGDIKKFLDYVQREDISDLFGNTDPLDIPLIADLVPVIGSRRCYLQFLKTLKEYGVNRKIVDLIICKMELLIKQWESFYHLLVKACLKRIQKDNFKNKYINEIFSLEIEVYKIGCQLNMENLKISLYE